MMGLSRQLGLPKQNCLLVSKNVTPKPDSVNLCKSEDIPFEELPTKVCVCIYIYNSIGKWWSSYHQQKWIHQSPGPQRVESYAVIRVLQKKVFTGGPVWSKHVGWNSILTSRYVYMYTIYIYIYIHLYIHIYSYIIIYIHTSYIHHRVLSHSIHTMFPLYSLYLGGGKAEH